MLFTPFMDLGARTRN